MGCGVSNIIAPMTTGITDFVGEITGSTAAGEAAQQASATQAASARLGIDEERRQFDKITEMMLPYLEAGSSALSSQQELLGLRGRDAIYGEDIPLSEDEILNAKLAKIGTSREDYDKIMQGGGMLGGVLRATLNDKLAGAEVQTTRQGELITGAMTPEEAQAQAMASLQSSPQYQALTQSGEDAILQRGSATGGLRGGNVQSALAQFRPQILSQLIESQYNKLGGMTNLGQASAGLQASYGQQTGSNISNLLQQQGAAVAGGQLAAGQAGQQTFNNMLGVGGIIAGF